MGHRSIALLVGAFIALTASHIMALGLGEISLDSVLNEPLKADIELYEIKELTVEEIKVGVASREDFDRIGIDKVYFLSDLKFNVRLDAPGGPIIEVTSTKPVREPFLNFLVELKWPSGKLLREYTVLLDLPVYSDSAPASAVQSTTTQQAPAEQTQQVEAQPKPDSQYLPRSEFKDAPPRPTAASRQVTPTYTEDSYRVKSNDTLWEIAQAVRPDSSVSVHQTMLALQRENPEAFINNNINLLKAGQILRIPDSDQIRQLEQRAAVQEVAVQNAEWSGRDVAEAQISGSRSVYDSESTSSGEREGRVKLTSPDEAYGSQEGRASGSSAQTSVDALENELAITMEQLDNSQRENDELRSKVQALEEQMETMQRLLEVSNENLAALELSLKKNADAAGGDQTTAVGSDDTSSDSETTTAATEAADESAVETEAEDSAALAEEGQSSEADTADAANETAAKATPKPVETTDPKKVVITPPAPQKSIVDIIFDNIIFIVAGLVVIAGGIFIFLRQRSSDEEDFDAFMEENEIGESGELEGNYQDFSDDQEQGYDEFDFEDNESGDDGLMPPETSEDDAESPLESEAETEDVVAEADIYIAYGKYDQAEEMLLNALKRDDSDENVRLKLLEVYASQDDIDNFDPQYAKLHKTASAAIIDRADNLRSNIANAPEFDEGKFADDDVGSTAQAGLSQDDDEDDMSFELDLGDESAPGSDTKNTSDDLSLDLDLGELDSDGNPDKDLDLDFDDEGDDSNNDLNFDLDELGSGDASGKSDSADEELDFDLDEPEGSESNSEEDFDLDFDMDEEPKASAEEASDDDAELDLDFGLDDEDGSGSTQDDTDIESNELDLSGGDDLDLGDLDLELDSEADDDGAKASKLEDDLASLDDDLAFDSESDKEKDASSGEYDLQSDLDSLDSLDSEFSLDKDIESDDADETSDTQVNDALGDDFLEQDNTLEPSTDLDLGELALEEDAPSDSSKVGSQESEGESKAESSEDEDEDFDLSSLDKELDDLTAETDSDDSGIADVEDSQAVVDEDNVTGGETDESLTDFSGFEQELNDEEADSDSEDSDSSEELDYDNMGEDTAFNHAIGQVPKAESSEPDFELPDISSEDSDDDELDFLSDSDETATKLDLARAYIDMGDQEGAREIIKEVMEEGNDEQKTDAEALLARIES